MLRHIGVFSGMKAYGENLSSACILAHSLFLPRSVRAGDPDGNLYDFKHLDKINMSNGQTTITLAASGARRQRKRKQKKQPQPPTVRVQVERPKQPKRRKPRKPMAQRDSGAMVPVPSDTKSAQGSSAARQITFRDIKQFATQMIAPHFTGDMVRSPCLINFKNQCTKFNKVVNLTAPASGSINGRFVPQPHFIEIANLEPFPEPPTVSYRAEWTVRPGTSSSQGVMSVRANGITKTMRAIKRADANGLVMFMFPMTVESGVTTIDTNLSDHSPINMRSYDANGTGTLFTQAGGVFTAAANGDWITIVFATGQITPVSFWAQVTSGDVPAGYLYEPYPVALPANTQTLRATILTGLVSFTGSSLVNQGNIVMALTDPGWEQEDDDLYEALSSLPDKRFNGPLKRGSYGWWSPLSIEEETPQGIDYFDLQPNTSCLRFAIRGAAAGDSPATIKVEGNLGVEFYSPDQVFSHVPCIPKAPVYGHLYHMFNHLPHVMPNDEHDDICKGLLKQVSGTITKAVKNPGALALGLVALG